jgi:hypothetical protein
MDRQARADMFRANVERPQEGPYYTRARDSKAPGQMMRPSGYITKSDDDAARVVDDTNFDLLLGICAGLRDRIAALEAAKGETV